jgi:hypothetical protein
VSPFLSDQHRNGPYEALILRTAAAVDSRSHAFEHLEFNAQ